MVRYSAKSYKTLLAIFEVCSLNITRLVIGVILSAGEKRDNKVRGSMSLWNGRNVFVMPLWFKEFELKFFVFASANQLACQIEFGHFKKNTQF